MFPLNSTKVQAFDMNGLEIVDMSGELVNMIPYEDIHVELLIEVLKYIEDFE